MPRSRTAPTWRGRAAAGATTLALVLTLAAGAARAGGSPDGAPDPSASSTVDGTTGGTEPPGPDPLDGGPEAAAAVTLTVSVDEPIGPANTRLAGIGWNTGDLSLLDDYRPPVVRIDARLASVAPGPDELDLSGVLADVADVRSQGGEPLVILYPRPAWLGGCPGGGGCEPTLVAPDDLDGWHDLLTEVVTTLATAEPPATRFEVWNEPDLPVVFWQDSEEAWLETVLVTHAVVAEVESATGIDLEVGGPATSGPGPLLGRYVEAVTSAGLPLDFVSWHHYANAPNLGPDGNEGLVPDVVYEALAGLNPGLSPTAYGDQTWQVREQVAAAVPDGIEPPVLVLDEWNVSAGGLDLRHDDHEGAAFAAAALIEMEEAGLHEALLYRAVESDPADGRSAEGDWGVVAADGSPDPQWWVLRAWSMLTGDRLPVQGTDRDGGLWARAVVDDGLITVLMATFRADGASARRVSLVLDGRCAAESVELASIQDGSADLASSAAVPLSDGRLTLQLRPQSVTVAQARCVEETPRTVSGSGPDVVGEVDSSLDPVIVVIVVAVSVAFLVGLVALARRRDPDRGFEFDEADELADGDPAGNGAGPA